jgi:hypothetical protein
MSWAYLGLDSLFNTVYNTVVSLYQAFLSTVSSIDPRYLLTAGSGSAVSTVVEDPTASPGVVTQVLNLGASVLSAIASVPSGIINLVRGSTAPEATNLLGDGKYPLAIIPQGSSSMTGALMQAVESHPYLALGGCALAVTGGALLYSYYGFSDKDKDIMTESLQTTYHKRIRKTEVARLNAEAENFKDTSDRLTKSKVF